MKVIITKDYEEMSKTAATLFAAEILENPNTIIGLATGSTSMGIGTIMSAKKIVLLVTGAKKARILKEVIEGPVTPRVPGSILQFHPHVIVICDVEAAQYL